MNAVVTAVCFVLIGAGGDSLGKTEAAERLAPPKRERIRQLVRGLGSDSFRTREASENTLAEIGDPAVPLLKQALSNPDPEVRRRAKSTLAMIRWHVSPVLRRITGDLMVGFQERTHTEREIIVRALASVGKEYSIATLSAIVEAEEHRGVWLAAVWALFDMGSEGELALAKLGVSQNWPERLDVGIRVRLGNSLLEDGQPERAMEQYSMALKKQPENRVALYNMACSYSLMNKVDQAVKWLRKAIDAGYDDAEWMANDTDLDNIREHPKFKDMLRELRVKEQLGTRRDRPET